MKGSRMMKSALTACAIAALLSGCGGASLPFPSTASISPPGAPDSAKSENLLYVIVSGFSDVYYYSYLPAQVKLIGKLTGLNSPKGLCVGESGNVFVTGPRYVVEYAHGGTKPIATLKIPKATAYSCAVDPA